MTYKITFLEDALKEWKKLSAPLRLQFKKKLAKVVREPRIKSAALSGMQDCYKIKLRAAGYRLVYRVFDGRLVVQVIAVGRRDKNKVYNKANERL